MVKFYETDVVRKLSDQDFKILSKEFDVPEAHLRAVTDVEARGTGYYPGTGKLVALYEPHIAYRSTSGSDRKKLVAAGLAYPSWKRNYPKTSYDRIDQCTALVGEEIAALSTSWALGQIMGFNFAMAGYRSALDMVKSFTESEANQLRGMLNFIKNKNLISKLKQGDWRGFAAGYNGAGYEQNSYHTKLESAANKWKSKLKNKDKEVVADLPVVSTLSKGSKGEDVKALQKALIGLGFDVNSDGDFGGHTEEIVTQFQETYGLTADGRAGPATRKKIADLLNEKSKQKALEKNVPVQLVAYNESKVMVGEAAETPVLVEQPELDKPISKSKQFWLWLTTPALTGAATWFQDWRVLAVVFAAVIIIAIVGILAQNKLISTYKNFKKALEE